MDKTTSGWINGFHRRADLQRLAAGDARRGGGFRSGLPDRGARRDRRRAGARSAAVFRREAAGARAISSRWSSSRSASSSAFRC